jgi:hypothetical protein
MLRNAPLVFSSEREESDVRGSQPTDGVRRILFADAEMLHTDRHTDGPFTGLARWTRTR